MKIKTYLLRHQANAALSASAGSLAPSRSQAPVQIWFFAMKKRNNKKGAAQRHAINSSIMWYITPTWS